MGLCITSIVKTLTDNRTLDDRNHQGHHTTLLLSETVVHSPSKSVRRRSQELGINRESVRRILIADLHMYPYRVQIKQKLMPDDMRKRVIMCQWFCDKINAVPDLWQVWPAVVAGFTGLEPPRFFICGDTSRTGCMATTPRLIPDLKAAITAAIRAIPREECGRVIENFARRIQMCLQRRGAHLEHIF